MRSAMVRRLEILGRPARVEASEKICKLLLSHPDVINAKTILIFASDETEPDLTSLIGSAPDRRTVFPKVEKGGKLSLYEVANRDTDFEIGAYNLREPIPGKCPEVELEDIDVVIAPGRAFSDENGARLGRGGGFYDRLLRRARLNSKLIGTCFRCQIVHPLPVEDHDEAIGTVVTEAGLVTVDGIDGEAS